MNRNGIVAKWGQSAKAQKTVESAMTDSFVAQIKEYAKQDQAFKEACVEIRAAAQVS